MAEQRRYMFDMDFTPGAPPPQAAEGGDPAVDGAPQVQDEPPPPPAAMFSEEELNLARDTAFEEGRRIGFSEGQEAAGVQIAQALDAITRSLPAVAEAQSKANDLILSDAVKLAMATMRRAMPATAEKYAFDEVAKVVADLVPHLLDEPRIIVRVALPLVDTMRQRLEQVAHSTGFEGRMVVQEDARLGPGDCKVEWADGGAERDLSRLLNEMDQIVDRAFESASIPNSENAAAAEPETVQ